MCVCVCVLVGVCACVCVFVQDPLLLPWSQKHSLSSDKLEKIEQLLAGSSLSLPLCLLCLSPSSSVSLPLSLSLSLPLFLFYPSLPLPPVAITRCQYQDPSNSMEMTFALYHNLILFQLTHRSQEIAHQTLSGLLNCSPHSTQLWMLATRFQDWTSSSATALDVIRKATEAERDATVSKLCFYATKLVLKQVYITLSLHFFKDVIIFSFARDQMVVVVTL